MQASRGRIIVLDRIIALDPGGTTGWAAFDRDGHSCGEFGPEPHHDALMTFLTSTSPDAIICEDFVYRQRTAGGIRMKVELTSVEYIGIVRLYVARRYGACELIMQPASVCNGTRLVTDEFVKALGLWKPGLRHAMDAREHLLYYMVTAMGRKDLIPKGL